MTVPRRHLLQASLMLPTLARAAPDAVPEAELAPLLRERLRQEGVGLAAARVLADGQVQLAAQGRSGLAAQPLTADNHLFEIGSITKTFVGLLLADAVVRGELTLDTPVEDLLPDGLPLRDAAGLPLRLVDVATHRSGLPRLPLPFQPKDPTDPYADFDADRMRAALRAFKPQRGREEAFEYSNLGFGLLGWLLARRAGLGLDALLQARVLGPLGLGGAPGMVLQTVGVASERSARGHSPQGQRVPAWHFTDAAAGAGALLATAAQMARYAQAALTHFEHPLQAAFALALTPHSPLGPSPKIRLGLAWMLVEHQGRSLASHDGGTGGFSSSLWLDRTRRRAGLVLANAQVPVTDLAGHAMDPQAKLRDLAAERRAQAALTQQAAQRLAPEQLAPLAGLYALTPQFKVRVRAEGARLFAQATGQGEFELFAQSARRFFARVEPLEIAFDGDDGVPAAFTLHQGGVQQRFVRE